MHAVKIPLRRGTIAAFWMVVFCIITAGAAVLAAVLGAELWWIWGLLAGILPLLPGLFRRSWFEYGVRAWNKGARTFGAWLRKATLKLCYSYVFLFAARPGSTFQLGLSPGEKSLWKPRTAASGGVWEFRADRPGAGPRWLSELLGFTRRRGNRWMALLVPFIVILMLLGGEEQEDTAPPASTYTLY